MVDYLQIMYSAFKTMIVAVLNLQLWFTDFCITLIRNGKSGLNMAASPLKQIGITITDPLIQLLDAGIGMIQAQQGLLNSLVKNVDPLAKYILLMGLSLAIGILLYQPFGIAINPMLVYGLMLVPQIPLIITMYNIIVLQMDIESAFNNTRLTEGAIGTVSSFAFGENWDIILFLFSITTFSLLLFMPSFKDLLQSTMPSFVISNITVLCAAGILIPIGIVLYFWLLIQVPILDAFGQMRLLIKSTVHQTIDILKSIFHIPLTNNYNQDLTDMELLFFGQLFGDDTRQFLKDATTSSPLKSGTFAPQKLSDLNNEFFGISDYQAGLYNIPLDRTMSRIDYIALPFRQLNSSAQIQQSLTDKIVTLLNFPAGTKLSSIPDYGVYDEATKKATRGLEDYALGKAICQGALADPIPLFALAQTNPDRVFSGRLIPIPIIIFEGDIPKIRLSGHTNLEWQVLVDIEDNIKRLEQMAVSIRKSIGYSDNADARTVTQLSQFQTMLYIMNNGLGVDEFDKFLNLEGVYKTGTDSFDVDDYQYVPNFGDRPGLRVVSLGLKQVRTDILAYNRKKVWSTISQTKNDLMTIASGYAESIARLNQYIRNYRADPAFNGINTKFNMTKDQLLSYKYTFATGSRKIMIMSDYDAIAVLPANENGALSTASLNVDTMYAQTMQALAASSDVNSSANLFALTDIVFELIGNGIDISMVAKLYTNQRASSASILFDMENQQGDPLYAFRSSNVAALPTTTSTQLQSEFAAISQVNTSTSVLVKSIDKAKIAKAINAAPTRAGEYPEFTTEVGGRYIKRVFYNAAGLIADVYKSMNQIITSKVICDPGMTQYSFTDPNDPIDMAWMRYDLQNWKNPLRNFEPSNQVDNFIGGGYTAIKREQHRRRMLDVLIALDSEVGVENTNNLIQYNPGLKQKIMDAIDFIVGYNNIIEYIMSPTTIGSASIELRKQLTQVLTPTYFRFDGNYRYMCLTSLAPVNYSHFHINIPLNIRKFSGTDKLKSVLGQIGRISDVGDLGLMLNAYGVSDEYIAKRREIANSFIIKLMLDVIWWPYFCSRYMYPERFNGEHRWSKIMAPFLLSYTNQTGTNTPPAARRYNSPAHCLGWGLLNVGMDAIYNQISSGVWVEDGDYTVLNRNAFVIENEFSGANRPPNCPGMISDLYWTICKRRADGTIRDLAINGYRPGLWRNYDIEAVPMPNLQAVVANNAGPNDNVNPHPVTQYGKDFPLFPAMCRAYRHDALIAYCFYVATIRGKATYSKIKAVGVTPRNDPWQTTNDPQWIYGSTQDISQTTGNDMYLKGHITGGAARQKDGSSFSQFVYQILPNGHYNNLLQGKQLDFVNQWWMSDWSRFVGSLYATGNAENWGDPTNWNLRGSRNFQSPGEEQAGLNISYADGYRDIDRMLDPISGTWKFESLPSSWDWLISRTSIGSSSSTGPSNLYDSTYAGDDLWETYILNALPSNAFSSNAKTYAKFAPNVGGPQVTSAANDFTKSSRNYMRLAFFNDPFSWFDIDKSYQIYPFNYVANWIQPSVPGSVGWDRVYAIPIITAWSQRIK